MLQTEGRATQQGRTLAYEPSELDIDGARRLRWYREVGVVLAFYALYSLVRNQFGSASVSPRQAYGNALRVIDIERSFDLFVEHRIQRVLLGFEPLIKSLNVFYGTLHFIVTIGVLVLLFRRAPRRYRQWRTTLGVTTGLALVGFSLFPLMPPRLLNDFGPFGGRSIDYRFVDTLEAVGGLWSFNSDAMKSVSNQYAAMPSLHVAWALWCACALMPFFRSVGARILLASYPVVTVFAVIVTGNHYWLDAVAGATVLGIGWVSALAVQAAIERWRRPRSGADHHPVAVGTIASEGA
ncbi:MAG: phosphatase PAP2 family protein [Acidimicrobiia bacterium]|nr:phosphatase PAP2 family protein [Acidimicrobiia bacterium]